MHFCLFSEYYQGKYIFSALLAKIHFNSIYMRKSYNRFKIWVSTSVCSIFVNNSYEFIPDEEAIDSAELYDLTKNTGISDSGIRIKEVAKAVAYMHEDLRIPLSMFLGGYAYEEIAKRLKIPESTVKGRIVVARQELHGILSSVRDNY